MNGQVNAIVVEMWYDKVSYPELRSLAQEAYDDWQPDTVLIEKKASGQSLLQDLRMGGITQYWHTRQIETRLQEHIVVLHY